MTAPVLGHDLRIGPIPALFRAQAFVAGLVANDVGEALCDVTGRYAHGELLAGDLTGVCRVVHAAHRRCVLHDLTRVPGIVLAVASGCMSASEHRADAANSTALIFGGGGSVGAGTG